MTDPATMPIVIAADHPAFAGHFPGMPIVPGVVLLDEVLHAMAAQAGNTLTPCTLESVKFKHVLRPGEPLTLTLSPWVKNRCQFDLHSGDRWIATGRIVGNHAQ